MTAGRGGQQPVGFTCSKNKQQKWDSTPCKEDKQSTKKKTTGREKKRGVGRGTGATHEGRAANQTSTGREQLDSGPQNPRCCCSPSEHAKKVFDFHIHGPIEHVQ